jgi:hypothetical protein
MLLFLNAEILDDLNHLYYPSNEAFSVFRGLYLKAAIRFALQKEGIILCEDI